MERLLSLPCSLSSPRTARQAVVDLLAPSGVASDRLAVAQAVVSELVANGVMHGDSDVELLLSATGRTLHIEVVDSGGGTPTMLDPSSEADRGRGLLIVQGLADRWGVVQRDRRKAVWADVALGVPAVPEGARQSVCSSPPRG